MMHRVVKPETIARFLQEALVVAALLNVSTVSYCTVLCGWVGFFDCIYILIPILLPIIYFMDHVAALSSTFFATQTV